jgi:hypothetical protein
MAVANGFGKVTMSGSVFMYDTGDTINSYLGEPTTNVFKHYGTSGPGSASDNAVNFEVNGNGTFIRLGYGQTFGGYTIQPNDVVYKYNLGDYGCHYHGNDVYVPSGTYVTFTFDYYISPGAGGYPETNYLANMETGTGASAAIASPNSLTGVWQTISVTAGPTTSAGNLRPLLYPGACGGRLASSGYILFKNPQVEYKSHKTQFTQTSRSVSGSLLPLVGNSTINLSNVSFDSNAQIVFDGTDDFIDTDFPAITINNPTIEAVVYRNQSTGRYESIIQNNIAGDDALYVYPGGNLGFWPCVASNLSVPTGQWSYVAVSYDGSNLTYCVNGVTQVVSATCADITDWDFLRIGAYGTGDGERWIGKISVAKVYDRALSIDELKQNYNKYKSRFNLP